jgi:hypothetical protein
MSSIDPWSAAFRRRAYGFDHLMRDMLQRGERVSVFHEAIGST